MRTFRRVGSRVVCLLQERLDAMDIERLVQYTIGTQFERTLGDLWRAERGHHHDRALGAQDDASGPGGRMERFEFLSVEDFQGQASLEQALDPASIERAGYIRTLQSWGHK